MTTVIRIGATPQKYAFDGLFFDGKTAQQHQVQISIDDAKGGIDLVITGANGLSVIWPLNALRRLADQAGSDGLVLHLIDDPVQRLILRNTDATQRLIARCPDIFQKPPAKGLLRIGAWSLAAITSVALIIFVLIPVMADQMAMLLPPKGEKALGDATFDHIRNALSETEYEPIDICDRPRSVAALDRLRDRLTGGLELPYPISLHVLDSPVVNAFALPGGYVVLFRGLIEQADTPDELASVFAHELGHVAARDPSRSALRSAGSIGVLGLLLGDFAGGAIVLFLAERLIDASYSQKAELAADDFAAKLMAQNNVAPGALADMFERFAGATEDGDNDDENGLMAHFASHPEMTGRIAGARAKARAHPGGFQASLSDADWLDLRMICGKSYSY